MVENTLRRSADTLCFMNEKQVGEFEISDCFYYLQPAKFAFPLEGVLDVRVTQVNVGGEVVRIGRVINNFCGLSCVLDL